MIHLTMSKSEDNRSWPVSLEIDDRTYTYPQDMFRHLDSFINYEIKVTTFTSKDYSTTSNKIIKRVFINQDKVYTIELQSK